MEAEVRAILTEVCAPEGRESPADLQRWVDGLYGSQRPAGVVEALLAERRQESARE
jgi:hypothetical protein